VVLVVFRAGQEELTEVTLYFQLLPLLAAVVEVAGQKVQMEYQVVAVVAEAQVVALILVRQELELQIKVLAEEPLVTLT
jgi:hypothetical protein